MMLLDVERKVKELLDIEDYNCISVYSDEDIKICAEKYDLQVKISEFPNYLPYTMMVIYLNDLVLQYFQDNFEYYKHLIDEDQVE